MVWISTFQMDLPKLRRKRSEDVLLPGNRLQFFVDGRRQLYVSLLSALGCFCLEPNSSVSKPVRGSGRKFGNSATDQTFDFQEQNRKTPTEPPLAQPV